MPTISLQNITDHRRHLLLAAFFILGVLFVYLFLPVDEPRDLNQPMTNDVGYEWKKNFKPAAENFINFNSPYSKCCFFNPPWTLIPLLPLTLLVPELASAVLFVANLFVFGFVAVKMGAKPFIVLVFLTTPQVLHLSFSTNIDFLVPIGFILPPQIGLFFVFTKPQIGIPIAIFWFFEAWRDGGIRNILIVFGPFSLMLLLSFILYGFWPQRGINLGLENVRPYNSAVWPFAIPIGLALLTSAIRNRKLNRSIIAAPLLTTYIAPHSWSVPILGLLPDNLVFIAGCFGLWISWLLNPCFTGFGLFGNCS